MESCGGTHGKELKESSNKTLEKKNIYDSTKDNNKKYGIIKTISIKDKEKCIYSS